MKILVIEDMPEMRNNICTILEMEGYEVLTAPDGHAGAATARRRLPDLILCDVMMPEMDGYAVLTALRSDPATAAIPFIFLTAKSDRRDLRAGMNLGADDYLTKPVTASDLLAAIAARFVRERHRPLTPFAPDFSSAVPLEKLGLTPREAEVLLWVAQGKTNAEAAAILGTSDNTVKKHLQNIFAKLGLESRSAAGLRALETLAGKAPQSGG